MAKARILIVEDEVIVASDLESRLTALGYEVCGKAVSGRKAIDLAEKESPSLILMDIIIKGDMDGIETADKISSSYGIPIIFLTAHSNDERLERAKLTLPYGYVLKPFQERELKVAIEMALYIAEVNSKRKQMLDQQRLTIKVLDILNSPTFEKQNLIKEILVLIKDATGFEAVGIRVAEGEDYPYYETIGFPPAFVAAETYLCKRNSEGALLRDAKGKPIFECMCGNILGGRTDHSLPFFTDGGSFWTNSTTNLLASTSQRERETGTLNLRHAEGYESVALIPLTSGRENIGLLQFNDTRPGMFTPNLISFIEGLGASIGIALKRKRVEEQLRNEHDFANSLIDTAQVIILLLDIEGKIIKFNNYMAEISGYKLEEVQGQDWFTTFLHERNGSKIKELFKSAIGDIQTRGNVNSIITKDGRKIEIEWYDKTLKDSDDTIVGLLAIGRDLTEQRKAEEERIKLERRLNQSRKMEAIGTLAGGIAHDFNNILGAIMGYTQLTLFELSRDDSGYQNLTEALKAADRAKDLVSQILTFSRQTDGEFSQVKVSPIIEEVLKFLRSSLPSTIEIRTNIQENLGAVLADPTQIHQVMMNLGTNAAHAMRLKGGILGVELTENYDEFQINSENINDGKYLRLTVSDTGRGIDRENLDRIFEPYFTTKQPGEGTGMGLSVVHGIVKKHGGAIKVYSEPDLGSTFHVYLPVVSEAADVKKEAKSEIPTGSERILYIDDEQVLCDIGSQMLTRLGYCVHASTNSIEALEMIRQSPSDFDLIITDQTMPGLTGAEFSAKILNIKPDMPIILCTGFSEIISAEKAQRLGIRGFLMKPLAPRELAVTIRNILDEAKASLF